MKAVINKIETVLTGASIPPEAMMHFPPCFRFPPLFSKNCLTFWKIYKMLPFPEKISYFHPPKFLTTFFLVIDHKFRISPLFYYISPPPIRENLLCPPTFQNFPPVFEKFNSFLHTLRVISPPTLTMMHLCITQCTYWTPLCVNINHRLSGSQILNILLKSSKVVWLHCYKSERTDEK